MVQHRVSPYWHVTSRDPGSLSSEVVAGQRRQSREYGDDDGDGDGDGDGGGSLAAMEAGQASAGDGRESGVYVRAGPRRVAGQNVPTRMHKSRLDGQRNRGTRLGRGVAERETSTYGRTAAGLEHTVSVGVVRTATGGAAASVPSRRLCCSCPAPGSEWRQCQRSQHTRRWLLFYTDGGG